MTLNFPPMDHGAETDPPSSENSSSDIHRHSHPSGGHKRCPSCRKYIRGPDIGSYVCCSCCNYEFCWRCKQMAERCDGGVMCRARGTWKHPMWGQTTFHRAVTKSAAMPIITVGVSVLLIYGSVTSCCRALRSSHVSTGLTTLGEKNEQEHPSTPTSSDCDSVNSLNFVDSTSNSFSLLSRALSIGCPEEECSTSDIDDNVAYERAAFHANKIMINYENSCL